ncbi:MAG: GNAT family N-acetyltransferase [Flavobacteriaceae bacterium]|nr:GNAT family N-acetyltransferase [Flavobacteriaceae bacterium]
MIKILEGNEAIKKLKDTSFVTRWKELADHSEKFTVYLEFPYVSTWYRIYADVFEPILVLGYKNNELNGLIPLARSIADKSIAHAGTNQSEYHGWLSTKNSEKEFLIQALVSLRDKYNLKKWEWGFLPPNSNVNWLFSKILKEESIYGSVSEAITPLLDLSDETKIERLKKNKPTKVKFNRFKKRGDFYIERINSITAAEEIFDQLKEQYDFRQFARYQHAPFVADPFKKKFQIEKLNHPENCHFTVLWSQKKPVAFNISDCDSETVVLGVMSYDPLEEKNSPAHLHVIQLAELLKQEGYRYLDLTPGNNDYKRKYNNLELNVFKLTLYFTKKGISKTKSRELPKKVVKEVFSTIGMKPEKLSNIIASRGEKIKNLVPSKYKKDSYFFYKILLEDLPINDNDYGKIHINNYADLLLLNDIDDTEKSRILSQSLKRFYYGDTLYTLLEKDKLINFGWCSDNLRGQYLSEIDDKVESFEGNTVLYDFYINPGINGNKSHFSILEKMLLDCKKKGKKDVIVGAFTRDHDFRALIENYEHVRYCKLKRINLLWYTKTSFDYFYDN